MKSQVAFFAVLLTVASGCGSSNESKPIAANQTNVEPNPLTAPVDYVGVVAKAPQQALKTVDLATLNQAIQMFNAQEDRNPRDLKELVEKEYLAKLPEAPTGMAISYDPRTGSVRIAAKAPPP